MVKAKHITISQLAEILGISRTVVCAKVKNGQISASKIGKDYVISDGDILNILSGQLCDADKKQIDEAVQKVIQEYGKLLEMLGRK